MIRDTQARPLREKLLPRPALGGVWRPSRGTGRARSPGLAPNAAEAPSRQPVSAPRRCPLLARGEPRHHRAAPGPSRSGGKNAAWGRGAVCGGCPGTADDLGLPITPPPAPRPTAGICPMCSPGPPASSCACSRWQKAQSGRAASGRDTSRAPMPGQPWAATQTLISTHAFL